MLSQTVVIYYRRLRQEDEYYVEYKNKTNEVRERRKRRSQNNTSKGLDVVSTFLNVTCGYMGGGSVIVIVQ